MPFVPDLVQTVKVGSVYSENLTKVFGGAKNGIFSKKFSNIFMVRDVIIGWVTTISSQLQYSNFT